MRTTVLLVVALASSLAIACGRSAATQQNVKTALDQANMQAVTVSVDKDAKIVHLTGTVDTLAERSRAEEVASAAVGTTGRVLNELTVSGVDEQTANDLDGAIRDTLNRMMNADPVFKQRDINFQVTNGMVAITGEVRSLEEKDRVTALVRMAPGVKDVANGLEIHAEP